SSRAESFFFFRASLKASITSGFLNNSDFLWFKTNAMFLPMVVMVALMFFAFLIYPALNLSITADVDDISTIRDKYSIRRCQYPFKNGKICDRRIESDQMVGWRTGDLCKMHKSDDKQYVEENYKIENYCDCSDKTQCLIAKQPD
ncbi:hypothetical protein Bhyg_02370, partial [Pseudolycoriella hygida]